MKLKLIPAVAMLLLTASASAEGFKAGQWEFNNRVDGGGVPGLSGMSAEERAQIEAAMKQLPPDLQLPGGMSMGDIGLGGGGMNFTVKQCMREGDLVPPSNGSSAGQDCKTTRVDQKGDSVNFAVHCEGADGAMDGEGSARYTGSSMSGSMRMKGSSHGQPLDMTINTTGRYLGACK